MIVARHGRVLGALVLAGLSIFLFFRSQTVDWIAHDQYTRALLKVEGINADLNKNILKVRYQLLEYYDALVSELAMLKSLPRTLAEVPLTIDEAGQRELKQSYDLLVALVDEKGVLLERFKARNAVLKNSVRFLPVALNEARTVLKDKNLASALEGLLWDIQQYNAVASEPLEREIQQQLQQLATVGNRLPSLAARDAFERVLAHAKTVLEHTPVVNSLTTNLTWLPIGQWSNTLSQTYEHHHSRAVASDRRYRLYFSVCAAAFLLYTLGLILWQAHQIAPVRATAGAQYQPSDFSYRSPSPPLHRPDILEPPRESRMLTDVEHKAGHTDL